MRTLLALLLLFCGCGGRSHDDLQTCDPCGDADSDGDGDTDVDSDVDSDSDTDTDTGPENGLRPLQVCDFDEVAAGATSLRFMTEGCMRGSVACEVVETDAGIDLRPTFTPSGYDEGLCDPRPAWIVCEIPAGLGFGDVTVWGEYLATVHHESDMKVDHPDCVQLPAERVPQDCSAARPLEPQEACFPEAVLANSSEGLVTTTNPCECVGDLRDAGCEVREEANGGLVLTPLVSLCGECSPAEMCQSVQAACHLYDLEAGSYETSVVGSDAWVRDLSYTVLSQKDRWDAEIICIGAGD